MPSTVDQLTFFLLKKVNQAIRDYNLVSNGDRIAVAVSGGHDSLSLLHLLQARQRSACERYELVAIHVHGDARGPDNTPEHPALLEWLARSDIEYVVVPMELPSGEPLPLKCQRCTWNRRKTLFLTAHQLGCNVVALGHHFDDAVETTLMNLFYQRRLEGLAPKASYFGGQFTLIRPLIYVPKKELARLARAASFPPSPPACPESERSRRRLIQKVLQLVEQNNHHVRRNVFRAAMRRASQAKP